MAVDYKTIVAPSSSSTQTISTLRNNLWWRHAVTQPRHQHHTWDQLGSAINMGKHYNHKLYHIIMLKERCRLFYFGILRLFLVKWHIIVIYECLDLLVSNTQYTYHHILHFTAPSSDKSRTPGLRLWPHSTSEHQFPRLNVISADPCPAQPAVHCPMFPALVGNSDALGDCGGGFMEIRIIYVFIPLKHLLLTLGLLRW